jgi:hypothetical protein
VKPDITKARETIDTYCRKYAISPLFKMSDPYELTAENWTNAIPFPNDAGCYFFYAADGSLLYVGKASLTNDLAGRVTSYFQTRGGFLLEKYQWNTPPACVITLKVNHPYEAPSLEEYLIEKLQPPENSVGVRKVIS